MTYRVEVAGRIFQGTDPYALVRLAVQVRRGIKRVVRGGLPASPSDSVCYPQTVAGKPLILLHKTYAKR